MRLGTSSLFGCRRANPGSLTAGEMICADPNDPVLHHHFDGGAVIDHYFYDYLDHHYQHRRIVHHNNIDDYNEPDNDDLEHESTTTTQPLPPPDQHPIADIPSNFNTSNFLQSRPIPPSTADQPDGKMRTLCRPSHLAHDDPIVNPGTNSAHLHLFFGNTTANRNSTYTSLRTTGRLDV